MEQKTIMKPMKKEASKVVVKAAAKEIPQKVSSQSAASNAHKIVVVRIRTEITSSPEVRATFRMLNLDTKNHAVIIDSRPVYLGMLERIKTYITWGKLNPETEKALMKKKKENRKSFPLQPPLKGYGRKGIKLSFSKGGALGDRGEKINDLVMRMIR